jgi:hypothetical protein
MSGLQNLPQWAQVLVTVVLVAPGTLAFKRAYKERR